MTKHVTTYLLLTLWSCLLSGCSLISGSDTVELCIIYSSDAHSMVCPYDFHNNQPAQTSLCHFAALVRQQRAVYGDRCLVFDNGNKLSGGPTAYYYKFADTISEPISYRVERAIGYDALGIGARDIEIDECLRPKRHNDDLQPTVLCANLINRQTNKPVYKPYKIFERNGVRIAVIGMLAPTSGDWILHELWNQFETEDMIECAKKWIPVVREQEKADLVIGLFSSSKDYNDPSNDFDIDTYKNPAGGLPTAIRVPGFDLVLLGNSDEATQGSVINDQTHQEIPYMQCGSNAENAGLARIHFTKESDGTYSNRIFTTLIDLKQYNPDPVTTHTFRNAQDSIFVFFNRPIGYLKDSLILGEKGLYGPDYHRDMINTIQLWYSHADISFATVTAAQGTVKAGPLTMRQVFDIYPVHHQLQKLTMTGEEVRRFLEWGYTCQFETMQTGKDPLLLLKKDPHGHILYNIEGQPTTSYNPSSYVAAGGIKYTVDITKPAGERVKIHSWSNGSKFDPRGLYRVVVSSELLRDEGKFISRGLNWDREELSLHAVPTQQNSLRKIIYDYIRSMDTIKIARRNDWQVIPDHIWREAKEREGAELDPLWQ